MVMKYFVLEGGKTTFQAVQARFPFQRLCLSDILFPEDGVWLYPFNVDTFFGVKNKITVVGSSTEKLCLNLQNNDIVYKSGVYYM